ncbi:MAG: hypothetical protein WAO71_09300 [Gallionella sp.]
MEMVSYWKHPKEIYGDDEGLVLIIGYYDHKNENNGGNKALGIHWGNFPQSFGKLSPCVIPTNTRNAILSGLLHQAVSTNDAAKIASLIEAIDFFR